MTYIGTSAQVGWHEGTVFGSMSYGVSFRNKGAGVDTATASAQAASAAASAYSDMLGKKCSYKATTLERSRWATTPLGAPGRRAI